MYEYTVKGCPNVRSYECLAHELMIEPNFAATRKQQSFVGSGGQSAVVRGTERFTIYLRRLHKAHKIKNLPRS